MFITIVLPLGNPVIRTQFLVITLAQLDSRQGHRTTSLATVFNEPAL